MIPLNDWEFQSFAKWELVAQRERLQARAQAFRAAAAETHTSWRLGCVAQRRNWRPEEEIIRAGIAEIMGLRLEAAYAPIFQTLDRIDRRLLQVQMLLSNDDPYAPPRGRGA